MSEQHSVRLPYPARTGPKTIGACTCGWDLSYGWGGHAVAAEIAGEHIETEGHAQPVQVQEMSGDVLVLEGVSL